MAYKFGNESPEQLKEMLFYHHRSKGMTSLTTQKQPV